MNDDQTQREQLSALVDGEATSPSMPGVLVYAESDEGQQSWRMYHLIGDVLRSPELAHHSQHDILSGVRAHMEREPRAVTGGAGNMPLGQLQQVAAAEAAQPSQLHRGAANASVFRWKMAAGFASVAAVAAIGWGALLGGGADQGHAGAQLAALSPQSVAAVAQGASAALAGIAAPEADDAQIALGADAQSSTVVAVTTPNGQSVMLRDPRLDELLTSRNQFSSAANLQMPASFLRNANFATSQSAQRR
ncbi:sigma-E factor negative regulatory protein [Comamonas aquatilis]|uniref:sigma-E factor negative regulatory protein n=1 Tax=Comamonas aquatilis TaxID=1778406 RepID=UPI0039EF9FAF